MSGREGFVLGCFHLPLSVLYCFLDGETAWHFHSFGQSLLVSIRALLQLLAVCQCCHHLTEQHNSVLIKLSTVMELDLDCFASVTVVHCWSMLSPRTRRLDSSQIWR